MEKSVKIIKSKGNIDIVETEYDSKFLMNINRSGRKIRDHKILTNKQFNSCKTQKIKSLKAYNKKLDEINEYNQFNFFITLRGINPGALKKFLDRVRKASKEIKYIVLASWGKGLNLHYHILINTNLDYNNLTEKMVLINDYDIKEIYNQRRLINYFKKNVNYDTIHILRQNSENNDELKDKQIEILSYSKILNTSRNIRKPKIIKNPSQDELDEIRYNNSYIETIEYDCINSNVRIDKYELK